jgi:hypothetical protein
MQFIAIAIVFCFLMWKWPKRTLMCSILLIYISNIILWILLLTMVKHEQQSLIFLFLILAISIFLPLFIFNKRKHIVNFFKKILNIENIET